MNEVLTVRESHYLPLTSYFSALTPGSKLVWNTDERYQKQTLRNRTYILSANGILKLTVPVLHGSKSMSDVRIDYTQSWLKDHIRGITSAYKHSPYFDYYFPYFEDIFLRKPEYLLELNKELFLLCLKILKSTTQLEVKSLERSEEEEQEDENPTNLQPYAQVFGNSFIPNLSIIDLLFNKGPDSSLYLK